MLSMIEAKKLGVKAAGQEFTCEKSEYLGGGPTGSIGRILPELSSRGKLQAELTCTEEGCTNVHVREVSDWHQSTKCAVHAKTKKKSAGGGASTGRSIKLEDGTIVREMKVLDNDDAETRQLKEENNALFAQLFAAEQARRDQEKAAQAEARKAKQEAERAEREAKAREEKRKQLAEQKARTEAYAAKMGLKVSPKLQADIDGVV